MILPQNNDILLPEHAEKVTQSKKHIPKLSRAAIAVLLGLLLAIVCIWVIPVLQPPHTEITPDHLQNHLSEYRCFIQIKDMNEEYYQVESSEEFASLLTIGEWRRQLRKPTGIEMLVMKSGNTHWVFYSDGTVGAYIDFNSPSKKSQAYYKIPSDVADKIIDYIRTNSIEREAESFAEDFFEYNDQSVKGLFK